RITYNKIGHMGLFGLLVQNPADAGSGVPTLANSIIVGNEGHHSGNPGPGGGIVVGAGNSGIFLTPNNAPDNTPYDCQDRSTRTGTLGTANTWFRNAGPLSSPAGLCPGLATPTATPSLTPVPTATPTLTPLPTQTPTPTPTSTGPPTPTATGTIPH